VLTAFTSDATVAVLADWVELDHLLSERPRTTDSHAVRADRAISDELEHGEQADPDSGETIDVEILDSRIEDRRQRLWDELSSRQEALGDAYPFVVSRSSTGWRITARKGGDVNSRIARLSYVLSLLLASFRHQHIQKQAANPDGWDKLEREIAGRFQSLAVLAASNVFGPRTQVYWFGSPRPDRTGFLTALRKLVDSMGLGTLRDKPPYNTEWDQDATIDLVAWRAFADGAYGALVLYGQVASGNNWKAKSVYSHINDRFFQHFVDVPATRYLGATFIPFVMHSDIGIPRDGDLVSAIKDHARAMEAGHGILIDRIRIAELMRTGLGPDSFRHDAPTKCASARSALRWIKQAKVYCAPIA
jgi:hypothetical protein